ncbi:MAG: AAA family ATPase [Candidatus Aenigmarchaeota archaeon]|nr:AAA family ATPase [Candidatus Aenigmarchaeota archaeon]
MGRVKTGIIGLDHLLGGGLPEKSSIMLIGPPGCGKTTLAQQFMSQGIKEKDGLMYVTLDAGPEEIESSMKSFGWKTKSPCLSFIDGYSWRVGEPKGKHVMSNLGNINELNIAISAVIDEQKKFVGKRSVFDSMSTLLIYANSSLVVKFIPVMIAKEKKAGYTNILILEEGVHDQKTVTTLNYVTDGVIEFKMEGDKRFLRVSRMKATKHKRDWVEFKVTDKGIVLM